jgi:hypothetical protein
MSNRKLAAIVIALVVGIAVTVAWYLAGEQSAARERAETTPAAQSYSCAPIQGSDVWRGVRLPRPADGRRS